VFLVSHLCHSHVEKSGAVNRRAPRALRGSLNDDCVLSSYTGGDGFPRPPVISVTAGRYGLWAAMSNNCIGR
jgi:hypothetical protein